jgi:hypothetical protein
MFNLFKHSPVDPCQFLQLISEKTSPDFFWSQDTRFENRNNRTIPITISPWNGKAPEPGPMKVALTKDISTNGICLISPFEVVDKQIVVGMFVRKMDLEEPLFFLVDVCSSFRFAEGFWQVGVKARELLNTNFNRPMKEMIPMGIRLLSTEQPVEAGQNRY